MKYCNNIRNLTTSLDKKRHAVFAVKQQVAMSTQQRTLLRQLFSLANNIKHQLATAVSNNLDKRFIFTLRQSTSYHQQYLVSFFVYLLFAELMRVKSVPGEYFVRPLRVKPRDKDDTSTQINCLYLIDFVSRCYKTSFI